MKICVSILIGLSNIAQLFKINLLLSLILLVIIVIFRTIIATIVDNSLIPVIEKKEYAFSSDKTIYKKSSLITFLFTILLGIAIGTALAIAYVGILPQKKTSATSQGN